MLSRLFAFMLLLALVAGGLYYWKVRPAGADLGAMGQRLEDAKTTAAVRAAHQLSRSLKDYDVDVTTEEGVVTLRGEVPRDELRVMAERTAAAVPDVRQVVNHLKVQPDVEASGPPDRSLGEAIDDEALEVQVRLAFSLNRELKGTAIDVRSFRREVTLRGEVHRAEQKALAVSVARETAGVAEVRDELRVRGAEAPTGRVATVERALAANRHLAPYRIRVREDGPRLVLEGRVRSGAEKDLAGLVARDAAGGGPLDNALEVNP